MDEKLQKDELTIYTVIKESSGKTAIKLTLKRLIKHEFKQDKHENRIICLDEFRVYLLSINKSQKPSKLEHTINILLIKKIESANKNQLTIQTNDNHEFKFHNIDEDSTDIDDIITQILKSVKSIFPTLPIKALIDHVYILPEKRWLSIEKEIEDSKQNNDPCASYERAYLCYCDLYSINAYRAVGYDVNTIYTLNNIKEFCLTDFDYVAPKDFLPLLSALQHNSWFESVYSESIKFTNDLQDEICNLLTTQGIKIKSIKLIHSSLKSDFTQKLLNSYQQLTKHVTNKSTTKPLQNYLKCINLSRNSLEDKGATNLSQLFKEFSQNVDLQQHKDVLNYLVLSKCSINSKGINSLFTTLKDFSTTLRYLDLSFNSLKDDPAELFKFLSERNSLENLNLASSDVDLDKLFIALSKGGCDKSLKTLVLSGNTNYSTKNFNYDALKHFVNSVQVLNYIDVSSCKLAGQFVQNFMNGIQINDHLKDVHINLSSNDLSSSLKLFSNEFGYVSCITSLDLSDNGFDADFETILKNLQFSSIKHLCLSKNFQNIKPKLLKQSIITPLSKLVCSDNSKIESLWLVDCRLKSHLLDFLNELGSCNNLKLLDISGNDLGDLGINELAKSLQINRSIEILAFDRSNVTSPLAYEHIFDALKRNSTLKSLQIPTVDLFNLYQKSPEKIVETIKQMNELTLKRSENLTSENKCNIEQLFKTRMKLLNEPDKSNDINTPPSQRESSHQQTTLETKEIFESLNETVCTYLTENNNSLEKQFQQYQQELINKLDTIRQNLEIKINDKLNEKYPKYYTNKLKSDDCCNNEKINNLKEKLKNSMNSLFIQIHNQFSELNYELTETMATKFVEHANIEIQQQQQQQAAQTTVQPIVTSVPLTPILQQQSKPISNTQQQPPVNVNQIQNFQFRNKTPNSTTTEPVIRTSFSAGNIFPKLPRPISYQRQNDQIADTTNNANSTNNTSHMESLNESINNELNDSSHDLYETVFSDSEIIEDKSKPKNSNKPERAYVSINEDDEKPPNPTSTQSTSINKETTSSIVRKSSDFVTPDSSINKSTYEADGNIYDNIEEIINQPKPTEPAPSPAPRTKIRFGAKENATSSPIINTTATSTATAKISDNHSLKDKTEDTTVPSDTVKPQEDNKPSDSKTEKPSRGLVRSILSSVKPEKLFEKKSTTQTKDNTDGESQQPKTKYAPPPPVPPIKERDQDKENKEKEISPVKDKDKSKEPKVESAPLYDDIEGPPQEPKKLDHLNKNRANRPNVRKPSRKNATKIETYDLSEDLTVIKEEPAATTTTSASQETPQIVLPTPVSTNPSTNNTGAATGSNEHPRPPPAARQINGTSPLVGAKSGVEQPKVSIAELGGVKLRPTKAKPENNNGVIKEGEELQTTTSTSNTAATLTPTSTPTPPINNPISNRFSNRHSSYISPTIQNRISSVQNTITEQTDENSTNKPLTPPAISTSNSTNGQPKLPPAKPPKPLAPKPTITNEQTPPPQPLARLKPVNRNTTIADETSDQKQKLPIEIDKLDKRKSVRDMASHFLKEESKA